jgi:hypothetical protein
MACRLDRQVYGIEIEFAYTCTGTSGSSD